MFLYPCRCVLVRPPATRPVLLVYGLIGGMTAFTCKPRAWNRRHGIHLNGHCAVSKCLRVKCVTALVDDAPGTEHCYAERGGVMHWLGMAIVVVGISVPLGAVLIWLERRHAPAWSVWVTCAVAGPLFLAGIQVFDPSPRLTDAALAAGIGALCFVGRVLLVAPPWQRTANGYSRATRLPGNPPSRRRD
jgi:hypothetical protein